MKNFETERDASFFPAFFPLAILVASTEDSTIQIFRHPLASSSFFVFTVDKYIGCFSSLATAEKAAAAL